MRRAMALFTSLAVLLLLFACDTGFGVDLQLFTQTFNDAAQGRTHLDVTQFTVQETDTGLTYTAFVGNNELITVTALSSGRIHTVSVVGMPDAYQRDFFATALQLLYAFAQMEGAAAERMLQEIHVGVLPVLGMFTLEQDGFRLSYAANEAGRYFRLSCLRHLPPEVELPTLRERIE